MTRVEVGRFALASLGLGDGWLLILTPCDHWTRAEPERPPAVTELAPASGSQAEGDVVDNEEEAVQHQQRR